MDRSSFFGQGADERCWPAACTGPFHLLLLLPSFALWNLSGAFHSEGWCNTNSKNLSSQAKGSHCLYSVVLTSRKCAFSTLLSASSDEWHVELIGGTFYDMYGGLLLRILYTKSTNPIWRITWKIEVLNMRKALFHPRNYRAWFFLWTDSIL